MKQGLLYSQIGYDIGDPMKAYFRSDTQDALKDAYFEVTFLDTGDVKKGIPAFWGQKWKSYWWILDFAGIDRTCEFIIKLYSDGKEIERSTPIKADYNMIWDTTIKTVAIDAFEERERRARNSGGWKDCGSEFREVCSISPSVTSLCDLLNRCPADFTRKEQERLRKQIMAGADYLCTCMEAAEHFGLPKGAIVHDVPNYIVNIPGDSGESVIALAKAAGVLFEVYPEQSAKYLKWAKLGYEYILHEMKTYSEDGLNREYLGIPEDAVIPNEFMTKDLFLFMWAGITLYKLGQYQYEESILSYAKQIAARQIPEEEAEDGLYGHFYMYNSLKVSEKNFIHHHVGYDAGGMFHGYVRTFCELCKLWFDRKEVAQWKKILEEYTRHFFIPACKKNPFNLMPLGYYKGEGWLNFCGPWHGFNATIGFTASLALELIEFVPEPYLQEIAVSNIQWICGVNAGLTKGAFDSCAFWEEDIPEDKYISYSQIMGIGTKTIFCWSNIVGTIPNGFNVNSQFRFDVPNKLENDGPVRYTDEDWIPHSAGFIAAMTELSDDHYFAKVHKGSQALLKFIEENH